MVSEGRELILDAEDFIFELPPRVRWARRILIKPCAGYAVPYPATTSREILEKVITSIGRSARRDVILLGQSCQEEMQYLPIGV
jgi:hypothetical protein